MIMGSSTGVDFMSMTCLVGLSALNAVTQYSWQLLLWLLLNKSQLTLPIRFTFTISDIHTRAWAV